MNRLEKIETAAFKDGPKILLWVAVIFALTPVLILANGLFGTVENWPVLLKVIAVTAIPALLALALSRALKARHLATVPLTYAACALSLWSLRDGYASAIEGISPKWAIEAIAWFVSALEFVAIFFVLAVVTTLWRKGTFDRSDN